MSSRLATPISKLTRSISTSPAVARPSHLLNNATKTATTAGRKPIVADEPSTDRNHSTTTTPHRPTPKPSSKTIPFMQTFHHSAPKPAAHQISIDRTVLPNLHTENLFVSSDLPRRIPLLPDSTRTNKHLLLEEEAEAPLLRAQISVVAADPARVLPAALTEVEGMGVELGFVHLLEENQRGEEESFEMGRGMIRDLWRGMVEDFSSVGSGSKPTAA